MRQGKWSDLVTWSTSLMAVMTVASLTLAVPTGAQTAGDGGLAARLKTLENRVRELENHDKRQDRAALRIENGTFDMVARGTRTLKDTSICPEGEIGKRGDRKGRVTFAHTFAKPPEVFLALRQFDMAGGKPGDALRVGLSVTSVDENGFSYSFHTWCITRISSATAIWVAYGANAE